MSRPEVLNSLVEHFRNTAAWFSGFAFNESIWIVLGIILFLFFVLFKDYKRHWLIAGNLVFLLSPPVILLIHCVIPFERTWSYDWFFVMLGLTFLAVNIFSHLKNNSLIFSILVFLIVAGNIFLFVWRYPQNYPLDFTGKKIADFTLKSKFHLYYIESDYIEVLMYFYHTINHQSYQVDSPKAEKK